ncbi:MAG TPA: MMPL family transporter [Thermomicrobiales bacterium]|nr:MMPL family transporter [Thermomicrobiales bacterium]
MPSWLSTGGLARSSARHPWSVLGIWLVIVVLAVVAATGLGDVLTTESGILNDPDSVRGADLLEERLRGEDPVTETVIVHSLDVTVDDAAFRTVVEDAAATLAGMTGVVSSVDTYYTTGLEGLVSADRRTTLISVTLTGNIDAAEANTDAFLEVVTSQRGNGFEVYTAGDLSVNEEFNSIAETDLQTAEIVGLPIALIILVIVFGALVAAGVPIVVALVSIVLSLGMAAVIGRGFELSFFVTNMITLIGLAVGIDYALFVVERYREERRRGIASVDAIGIAGDTASKAVLFSGITVVLALLGMLLIPTTIFRSLGLGAILAVLAAVAATLTLLPAIVMLLGDKLDWPRRRRYDVPAIDNEPATGPHGFWGRVTSIVMARPVVAIAITTVLLVGAALPYLDLQTGESGVESLPESDIRTAYTILQQDFYAGVLGPVEIVIDGSTADAAISTGIDDLVEQINANAAFGPASVETNETGDLALISAPLAGDANAASSFAAIDWLRGEAIPTAFEGADAQVFVTGETAMNADFNAVIDRYTPIVFAFVLGLSFLLLTLAFRSLVVPLNAIVMNLLSVGATYGLLVLAFQKGYGEFLGFQQTPAIESWVPLFLFCVLFGLSMDYHVFLLSRIREHYDLTHDNTESVAVGLQSTAKIITGAALIMVAVFGGFATGQLVMFQQMGFGLAIAVLLDATIVRSVLVPASMRLLGDANWYFPNWLRWLPDVRVEGTPVQLPTPIIPTIDEPVAVLAATA